LSFVYYDIHMKRKLNLKSVVWKEGKYHVAQSLNVDVSSFGKTKHEALKNLDEALELYLEDAKASSISKIEHPEIVSFSLGHA